MSEPSLSTPELTILIKRSIRDKTRTNSSEAYRHLLDLLRTETNTFRLLKLYDAISYCVSEINLYEHHDLIETIFQFNWAMGRDAATGFVKLLEEMNMSHGTDFLGVTLERLVQRFWPQQSLENENEYDEAVVEEVSGVVHSVLQRLLEKIPMAKLKLVEVVKKNFPHQAVSVHVQRQYLKNMFLLMRYIPTMKNDIWSMILEHLLNMDVEVKLDFIPPYQLVMQAKDDGYGLFQEHSESSEDSEDDPKERSLKKEKVELAATLDILLWMVYEHLEDNDEEIHNTFEFMLESFRTTVLRTYESNFVQFLMFYLCSKNPQYSILFLRSLFEELTISNNSITPLNAAAYIGSFVARAEFLDAGTVRESVQTLTQHCFHYLSVSRIQAPVLNDHKLFYHLFQSLMFIFCFKHHNIQPEFAESLDINRIITSALNPLKVCDPDLVRNFRNRCVTDYPFVEVHTNGISALSRNGESNILTCIMPFDTNFLKKSSKPFESIYRSWEMVVGQERSEDDFASLDESYDDGFVPMSISMDDPYPSWDAHF